MKTLGELIDTLVTLNIKVWFEQDWVYKSAAMKPEDFACQSPCEIQTHIKRLSELNLARNAAMTEIDRCLAEAVASGKAEVGTRHKLT